MSRGRHYKSSEPQSATFPSSSLTDTIFKKDTHTASYHRKNKLVCSRHVYHEHLIQDHLSSLSQSIKQTYIQSLQSGSLDKTTNLTTERQKVAVTTFNRVAWEHAVTAPSVGLSPSQLNMVPVSRVLEYAIVRCKCASSYIYLTLQKKFKNEANYSRHMWD